MTNRLSAKVAVPCIAALLIAGATSAAASSEPAVGFAIAAAPFAVRASSVSAARLRRPPSLLAAAASPEAHHGVGSVVAPRYDDEQDEEYSSSDSSSTRTTFAAPLLDEAVFLKSMNRDLGDVRDLLLAAEKYGDALDEPAARMPDTSRGDMYDRAAARCRGLATRSVEETTAALAAEREEAAVLEEKKGPAVVEPRQLFGGGGSGALSGWACLSLAVSAAGLVAMNPTMFLEMSQMSPPPIMEFSSTPAVHLPSVDIGALLGVDAIAEGTKHALTAAISSVGSAAGAAQAEAVAMQSHAADLFTTTSVRVEAIAARVDEVTLAAPARLIAAQEVVTRSASDLTPVSLQKEVGAFHSETAADVATLFADLKTEAVTFFRPGRAIDTDATTARSTVEGAMDLLSTQIDAARAGAHHVHDSFARRAQDFTTAASQLPSLRVEPPDWRSIFARANEAEDANIAWFQGNLMAAKSSVTEMSQFLARAAAEGEESRDALLAQLSTAPRVQRPPPPELLTAFQVQVVPVPPSPPGAIIAPPAPTVALLPYWIDASTVGLARLALGLE